MHVAANQALELQSASASNHSHHHPNIPNPDTTRLLLKFVMGKTE